MTIVYASFSFIFTLYPLFSFRYPLSFFSLLSVLSFLLFLSSVSSSLSSLFVLSFFYFISVLHSVTQSAWQISPRGIDDSLACYILITRVYECMLPCMCNDVCNAECGLQL